MSYGNELRERDMDGTERELHAIEVLVLVVNFRLDWMVLTQECSVVGFGIKCV